MINDGARNRYACFCVRIPVSFCFPVWSYSVLEDEDIKANEILSNVSKASEIGRDWHLNLTIGSQIDSDVMQPMMEKILAGEDVAENVKAASDILDGIIAAQ